MLRCFCHFFGNPQTSWHSETGRKLEKVENAWFRNGETVLSREKPQRCCWDELSLCENKLNEVKWLKCKNIMTRVWRSVNYPSALWLHSSSVFHTSFPAATSRFHLLPHYSAGALSEPPPLRSPPLLAGLPSPGLFWDDRKLSGTSEGFRLRVQLRMRERRRGGRGHGRGRGWGGGGRTE